jgi:hypothetical protein
MRHRGVCRDATASRQRFERGSGSGRAAAHVMIDILGRATESSEPYVITALAQRWLGRFRDARPASLVCGHFENDSISALRTTRFRFENDSISHPPE